jgi:hypothetical protein
VLKFIDELRPYEPETGSLLISRFAARASTSSRETLCVSDS